MKEVELPVAKIETQIEKQQKKEIKFKGSLKPHQGHKCFELNVDTGEVKEAEFMEQTVHFSYEASKRNLNKRVLMKQGCIYVTALNKKNAEKKFIKMLKTVSKLA